MLDANNATQMNAFSA